MMRSTPLVLCALLWSARPAVTINLAQGTDRERQTKALLEQVLDSYDLSQYTFTRQVVIEERAVEIGDFVDVGDRVARIVDLDSVLVVGQAAERDINKVKVGMPGSARLISGGTVEGKIRFVGSTADAKTRTFRVELEVANPGHTIVQGVSAELHLPVADLPAHRVSPAILTLAENGDVGVKTIGPYNTVEFHAVTIVATEADGVWLAGLPPTVTFITVGQDFVTAGQKVEPVPESAQPQS
jgi:multidrug efflux system membrane fusion protein